MPKKITAKESSARKYKAALYRFFDGDDNLLYVGISAELTRRLYQHEHLSPWMAETVWISIEWHLTREQAIEAEAAAIINERPKYNRTNLPPTAVQARQKALDEKIRRSAAAMDREIVQGIRILEEVQFHALYTLSALALQFGVATEYIQWLIDKRMLGHVVLQTPSGQNRSRVTGWQLMDFLEYLQRNRRMPPLNYLDDEGHE